MADMIETPWRDPITTIDPGRRDTESMYSGRSAIERIKEMKAQYGERLLMLAHHYQRPIISEVADFVGDSFELARQAALRADGEYIIFCGVRFMAESAALLCQPHQKVIHPVSDAGCPLAAMAPAPEVQAAWEHITNVTSAPIIPICYMNSDAELKAFVGENGGLVCTSSNALKAFSWAFDRGEKLFFVPDRNLGLNTARQYGISLDETVIYERGGERGNLSDAQIAGAKVIAWDGYCCVHTHFTVDHVERARDRYRGAVVLAHLECSPAVVEAADFVGSTTRMAEFVKSTRPGQVVFIATEVNLIKRLSHLYPDRFIFPLTLSVCGDMAKMGVRDLAISMTHLEDMTPVTIDARARHNARLALERMLELSVCCPST